MIQFVAVDTDDPLARRLRGKTSEGVTHTTAWKPIVNNAK